MDNEKSNRPVMGHNIKLENRQRLEASGVLNVFTFNENNVVLNTSLGVMNIKGKNMKVNKLNVDSGDLIIVGEILSIVYSGKEPAKKENIIKKLFK